MRNSSDKKVHRVKPRLRKSERLRLAEVQSGEQLTINCLNKKSIEARKLNLKRKQMRLNTLYGMRQIYENNETETHECDYFFSKVENVSLEPETEEES